MRLRKTLFYLTILMLSFASLSFAGLKTTLNSIDIAIFSYINHFTTSPYCDSLMVTATYFGDGLVLILVVGIILYFFDRSYFKFNFLFFFTALILGGVLVHILKELFGTPRPFGKLPDVRIVCNPLMYNSFPSGHSQAAFTAATFLSKKIKRFSLLFFLMAALVGLSRIYIGVHFLSDVIAGAFIGIVFTTLFMKTFEISS